MRASNRVHYSMRVAVVCLIAFGLLISLAGCFPLNEQTFSGTVTDVTETVKKNSEGGTTNLKLVEVDNRDWYKVEDELFLGHFRSRDLWGSLEESKTYSFKAYGYRIGAFSEYPNIVEATEAQ